MALTLRCLFVTVSELWLSLIGGIKTPGAFLKTNRKEIKSWRWGRRRETEGKKKCETEGESGRSDGRLALQRSGGANESSGVLTMGRLCLRLL